MQFGQSGVGEDSRHEIKTPAQGGGFGIQEGCGLVAGHDVEVTDIFSDGR